MANPIPNTFVAVTGFRNINSEKLMTAIRFDALATAYVSGVTLNRSSKKNKQSINCLFKAHSH